MPLRLALTGATGFVGKSLVPALLEAGVGVRALARGGRSTSLPANVEVIEGTLENEAALQRLVSGCDVVLHMAGAVAGLSEADFMKTNFHGTNAVALAAKTAGIPRFVYVSSLAATQPQLGPYGKSKAVSEASLKVIFKDDALLILRPSAVYGPGDAATLPLLKALLSSIAVIPGTRWQRFSMIHVGDLASILVVAVTGTATGTFELDDGEGTHGWADLVSLTQKNFGTPKHVVYLPRPAAMAVGLGSDVLAKLRGRLSMVSTNQMRQLYHSPWACNPPHWPRKSPIPMAMGLPQTIRWYQARGLLPATPSTDRSGANFSGKASP